MVTAVILVLGAVACASHLERGRALYADGRYVEAAEVFEHTGSQLGRSSVREKAEYSAYRGLTLLALGDLGNAHRWLTYAHQLERLYPGSLQPTERADVDRGWYELGARLRAHTPRPAAPTTAFAASQSPVSLPPPARNGRRPAERSLANP